MADHSQLREAVGLGADVPCEFFWFSDLAGDFENLNAYHAETSRDLIQAARAKREVYVKITRITTRALEVHTEGNDNLDREGKSKPPSVQRLVDDPNQSQNNSSKGTVVEAERGESQGQSEQVGAFKDYYSQDIIRTGDLVATLWAYEPRAADEFHLERGDMIKVLSFWDDGWGTGVRVRMRAEDWREESKIQHDTADEGEVKALPLVCVCLPQHWRKAIEGESTEASMPLMPLDGVSRSVEGQQAREQKQSPAEQKSIGDDPPKRRSVVDATRSRTVEQASEDRALDGEYRIPQKDAIAIEPPKKVSPRSAFTTTLLSYGWADMDLV